MPPRPLLWCFLLVVLCTTAATAQPVPVLFDTDMDTDVDDVGALAVLHALADAGEVEILATMVSSRYPYAAPAVDVVNTYYGRPDLPIGVPKGAGATLDRTYRYAQEIAAAFPQDLPTNDAAPDAVDLYRRILAAQPDTSVVLVTVGYLTNVRDVLESGPDVWSELDGRTLLARKVKYWVCMGGRYPEHLDPGVYGNFKPDPEAAVVAVQHFPRPIVFTGLGEEVLTGSSLAEAPPASPVRQAYELYLGDLARERPSWDQIAVLRAVRGAAPLFEESTQGYNRIFDNGTNQWRAAPDTDHRLLRYRASPAEVEAVIEALMSRPPGQ